MKKNKDQVYRIESTEGFERPAIVVTVFGPPSAQFRAHTWGILNGNPFFDTIDGVHVELFAGAQYMIQTPAKGFTIDESGRHREIRKEESVILQ